MAASRLSPLPLFLGHWKSLADVTRNRAVGDWVTRLALLAAVALAPLGWTFGWSLKAPTPILAAVSLLAGALVGSFGQINTLRLKVTDRHGDDDPATQVDRDSLDESAAHLLMAAFLSAVTAVILVLGLNLTSDTTANPSVTGCLAPLAMATGTYAAITFFIALPRLYGAYVQVNDVSPDLSGYAKRRIGSPGPHRTGLEHPPE